MSKIQSIFLQFGELLSLETGDYVFRQGEESSQLYYVRSGLLKAYYVDVEGKQRIKSFLPEGSIIGSLVALTNEGPCSFSLAAIERGEVVALAYQALQESALQDIAVANELVGFLTDYGRLKERREYELLSWSPEQRYSKLLATLPDIVARVSQAEIAAYIGITPQALSRIKRRYKNGV